MIKRPYYLVFLLLAACVKPEQYPIEPAISFKSYDNTIYQTGSRITATLSFTDGDGDIGYEDISSGGNPTRYVCNFVDTTPIIRITDSLNLFKSNVFYNEVKDNCINNFNTAFVPNNGKYKSVQGEIEIYFTANCYKQCTTTNCVDTQYYYFRIRDRAGHYSNVIKTPSVLVQCN